MPNITKGKKLTAFGKDVKKRLIDLDMTQNELARMIGTSSPNLSYILYGDHSGEAWIPKIQAALGMKGSPPLSRIGSAHAGKGEKDTERRCG